MAWRLARSLRVLENEVQVAAPGTTVWTIGDQDHQDEWSDHNPNAAGVVCASDTLGNAGLDLGWYAERVRQAGLAGHPALKYVIYSRRIASRSRDWVWRPYGGTNPHTGHVHVSVGVGPDGRSTGPYDDTSPWGLLEEDDMELNDRFDVLDWVTDRFGVDSLKVSTALGSTYGHVRSARRQINDLAATQAAILAAVRGDDVVAAVRTELDRHRGALVDELVDELGPDLTAELRTKLEALRVRFELAEEPAA